MIDKVTVAFYNAKAGGLDDKLINLGSGGLGYSHCELVVDTDQTIGAHYTDNGVDRYYYHNLATDPRWTIIQIDRPAKRVVKLMERLIGTPYDTLGVAGKFIGIDAFIDDNKTWCSKAVAQAMGIGDVNIMPNALAKYMLLSGGYKQIVPIKTDSSLADWAMSIISQRTKLGRLTKEEFERLKNGKSTT